MNSERVCDAKVRSLVWFCMASIGVLWLLLTWCFGEFCIELFYLIHGEWNALRWMGNSTPIACLLIFGGPAEPALLLLLLLLSFLFEHESGFVCSNMDGVVT
jgi:hypothetical protein